MSNITTGRSQLAYPFPENMILYTPVPIEVPEVGGPTHTDHWATFGDLAKSLDQVFTIISNLESPYLVATIRKFMIDTRAAPVTVQLPAEPVLDQKLSFTPLANSYATNSFFLDRNGNPIMGVDDDVEIDVNGFAFDVIWKAGTIGWVIVPKGNTTHIQTLVLGDGDLNGIRTVNTQHIVTDQNDIDILVISDSAIVGNIELPDSTGLDPLASFAFLQRGAGQKTFIPADGSSDTILSLDNQVVTSDVGAMVQIIYLGGGSWWIGGALVL